MVWNDSKGTSKDGNENVCDSQKKEKKKDASGEPVSAKTRFQGINNSGKDQKMHL